MSQIAVNLKAANVPDQVSESHRWLADNGHNPAEVVPGTAFYDNEKGELVLDVFVLDKDGNRQPAAGQKEAVENGEVTDDAVAYKTKSATWKVNSPAGYGV